MNEIQVYSIIRENAGSVRVILLSNEFCLVFFYGDFDFTKKIHIFVILQLKQYASPTDNYPIDRVIMTLAHFHA